MIFEHLKIGLIYSSRLVGPGTLAFKMHMKYLISNQISIYLALNIKERKDKYDLQMEVEYMLLFFDRFYQIWGIEKKNSS